MTKRKGLLKRREWLLKERVLVKGQVERRGAGCSGKIRFRTGALSFNNNSLL
jgi:hypothetical protein